MRASRCHTNTDTFTREKQSRPSAGSYYATYASRVETDQLRIFESFAKSGAKRDPCVGLINRINGRHISCLPLSNSLLCGLFAFHKAVRCIRNRVSSDGNTQRRASMCFAWKIIEYRTYCATYVLINICRACRMRSSRSGRMVLFKTTRRENASPRRWRTAVCMYVCVCIYNGGSHLRKITLSITGNGNADDSP